MQCRVEINQQLCLSFQPAAQQSTLLCYISLLLTVKLGREIYDYHRNPNINDSDHLVGRTFLELVDCCLFISMIQSYTDGAAVPEMITVKDYQVLKGASHKLMHAESRLCAPCLALGSGSMQCVADNRPIMSSNELRWSACQLPS